MSLIKKILGFTAGVLAVLVIGLVVWISVAPPALLRIGTGYAAKIVCSNVFVANRDAKAVLADDVQAPGHPLLKLIHLKVDADTKTVKANLLGFAAPQIAAYRPGLGCTTVPDGKLTSLKAETFTAPVIPAESDALWPDGRKVETPDTGVQAVLNDTALTGPGMRAVIVIKNGKLIAETYGAGFTPQTPLLGWSMTKTVNAALVATRIKAGKVRLTDDHLFPEWQDDRSKITVASLMSMASGLEYNEDYGDVSDVSRMLFLQPDMAAFAAAKPYYPKTPAPGMAFHYSTGTSVLLTRVWMQTFVDHAAAMRYPREALFGPLGMTSAVLEPDESGTFSGGSYLYASARDWARFGQFLLQDGVWKDQRILPEGFVGLMRTSNRLSGGYAQAQTWLEGPGGPEAGKGLPADTFWLRGHDGQTVAVIASKGLVVVRMGLTPSKLDYKPEFLVKAVAEKVAT